jgi:arylsulfatase A-like enzyme
MAPSTDLRTETPTIAEYFKKKGYSTYFAGKWHLGDKPVAYPTWTSQKPKGWTVISMKNDWNCIFAG